MKRKIFFIVVLFLGTLYSFSTKIFSQPVVPTPDHVVILILENHGYGEIIGSSAAPHINALANGDHSALLTHSFAIEHPSQPNYLDFFAGCNQGVTDDGVPSGFPFTTDNLGRELLDAGRTFVTYSEDLPNVGYNGASANGYARKHNPAANWMGTGTNQIPSQTNQPFSAFPAQFSMLPDVCFIVPNLNNDMHDGSINQGDNWMFANLNNYIVWAKTHNSLFIVTFDEDDNSDANKVVTIFTGPMVQAGQYDERINHYSILRTVEDMYGLPYACNAATATPITDIWISPSGVASNLSISNEKVFSVYPNPTSGEVTIKIETSEIGKLHTVEIFDMLGNSVFEKNIDGASTQEIKVDHISKGSYLVRASDGKRSYTQKLIIQ